MEKIKNKKTIILVFIILLLVPITVVRSYMYRQNYVANNSLLEYDVFKIIVDHTYPMMWRAIGTQIYTDTSNNIISGVGMETYRPIKPRADKFDSMISKDSLLTRNYSWRYVENESSYNEGIMVYEQANQDKLKRLVILTEKFKYKVILIENFK